METTNDRHKGLARRVLGWVQDYLRASAAARRAHAIAVWGDGADDGFGARPERMYRAVRAAWAPPPR